MLTCPTCSHEFHDAQFCPTDGDKLIESAGNGDRSGEVIAGRFRLLRKVGEGGMGVVYEAEHEYIHKRVAIKLLRPEVVDDEKIVQRLQQEARLTSSLGHPNIVRVEDFGHAEDGSVYLAIEWLDGETLEDRIKRDLLQRDDALRIAAQICRALAAAHGAGVVHRDVKPANIFLVPDEKGGDQVKVLDFGIAKALVADQPGALTQAGTFVGTPFYMSPEQATGAPLDHRTDLYSMGVILYELFTGELPFKASSSMVVISQHINNEPEAPRSKAPDRDIDPRIEQLILRCMHKDPAQRPQTAQDLVDELNSIRKSFGASPTTRVPLSPPPAMAVDDDDEWLSPPRSNRRMLWIVLAVLFGGGGLGAAVLLLSGDSTVAVVPDAETEPNLGWSVAVDAGSLAARPPKSPKSIDAAPAGPPPRPTLEGWTFHGKADEFAFTVTLSPTPAMTGKPVQMLLDISEPEHHVTEHLNAGDLEVWTEFLHYKNHKKVDGLRQAIRSDGRVESLSTIVFHDPGKYHVKLSLRADGGVEVANGKFDICIGADLNGPKHLVSKICPRMNPRKPTPRGGHAH